MKKFKKILIISLVTLILVILALNYDLIWYRIKYYSLNYFEDQLPVNEDPAGYKILEFLEYEQYYGEDTTHMNLLVNKLYLYRDYLHTYIYCSQLIESINNGDLYSDLNEKDRKAAVSDLCLIMADCCFQFGTIRNGENWLSKAIDQTTEFEPLIFHYDDIVNTIEQDTIISIRPFPDDLPNLPAEHYITQLRRYIYLFKNKDLISRHLLEVFPEDGLERFDRFIHIEDELLTAIIEKESKKEYWEIDVNSYFDSVKNATIRRLVLGD